MSALNGPLVRCVLTEARVDLLKTENLAANTLKHPKASRYRNSRLLDYATIDLVRA